MKGGDEAAEGKTVPRAFCQVFQPFSPSEPRGGRWTTRGGLRGPIRQMAGEEQEVEEDGAGGCFYVARTGSQAAADVGKLAKMNRRAVWCHRAKALACIRASRMQVRYKCMRRVRITQELTYVRVARPVSPKARTPMLRRAQQRVACRGDTEALRRNERPTRPRLIPLTSSHTHPPR